MARARLVQAKWTERILDEVDRSLAEERGIPEEKRRRLRELINGSVADCLVEGYEPLIDGSALPDPDDRHVLAATIRAGAQVIVTADLPEFPADYLARWHVEAKSPADFVLERTGRIESAATLRLG